MASNTILFLSPPTVTRHHTPLHTTTTTLRRTPHFTSYSFSTRSSSSSSLRSENGWPTSTLFATPPDSDADRAKLIDVLQDWKTEKYKDILKSGTVEPRPGVLRLMDEAKASERFQGLDCFLAGDDVKEKKPDPSIYITASKILGVSEKACLVVEDSVIGLQAATKAGMSCVITYTSSTAEQDFTDAIAKFPDLSDVRLKDLEEVLQNAVTA
ncbi:hypothetical protein M8C21_000737 [Ambrosia artemisiifolia]|uniref:Uncharacterized protein n=1 Tax=Ambrosia artemisiifolia TaxID=4212 RepID=A0AAD5CK37_AMBAR|nr:hypothetical protein M8C21_000737 [Ambrosia artemisiifolia]